MVRVQKNKHVNMIFIILGMLALLSYLLNPLLGILFFAVLVASYYLYWRAEGEIQKNISSMSTLRFK